MGAVRMTTDQASALRTLVKEAGMSARVIAVTSGKGGVGKTSVAVNLSIACARLGHRVTLVDFDLGLANVDVLMDLRPLHNLSHVVAGKMRPAEVVVDAEGIRVLPGASGLRELADLEATAREELIRSLQTLERDAELLVIDTGAGISRNVVRVAASADEVLVLSTPEPTAIMDGYATIKMIAREPKHGRIRLVVNMAEERKEAERVSRTLSEVSRRFLSLRVDRLGYIPRDEHVALAVMERRPFGVLYPHCRASAAVRGIGRMLVNGTTPRGRDREGFFRRMIHAVTGAPVAVGAGEV